MKNRIAFYMNKVDRGPNWVAGKIGVHCSTVMNWRDNEDVIPRGKNIEMLAEIFNCKVKDLITW